MDDLYDGSAVVWTGDNADEVEAFAFEPESTFGFVVGSNYFNYRWYHMVWNKIQLTLTFLPEWTPKDDPQVLEVYPMLETDQLWHWHTAKPGQFILRDGSVI